jgi:hypothetical protein
MRSATDQMKEVISEKPLVAIQIPSKITSFDFLEEYPVQGNLASVPYWNSEVGDEMSPAASRSADTTPTKVSYRETT